MGDSAFGQVYILCGWCQAYNKLTVSTGCAVAALEGVLVNERLLERMESAVVGQALGGGDLCGSTASSR
jgi:hypothetical protein